MANCNQCGAVLDWLGRCGVCARMSKLGGTVQANGGFRSRRQKARDERHKVKTALRRWSGTSGVDNALPNGDKED